ncbi:uncharacterized protein LOC114358436 [Ostrinia furnacalis]|uniref:uncharacterized protein LOC114358436 n=1 Tax=Ostrinia furnacalis TaxID=93504 RepID=UPI00103B561D|nr:uncharacterized protein LOC114358436 [Ostrinia furnacalis]
MDTLSYYLFSGYNMMSGRRAMNGNLDPIPDEVKSASLCKKLDFCKGKLEKFVNEYVTSLAQGIEAVFDGIFNEKAEANLEMTTPIFGKLKGSLSEVRKILKVANDKVTEAKEAFLWTAAMKKISSVFQMKSITYIVDRLDKDADEIKKKLTQKLVINIAAAEGRAERKLCYEYHICLRGIECTRALNSMLEKLITLPDDKIKTFMKAFYEALPETTFYSRLSEVTANELQIILNDMAYFDNVPTREILTSIQTTVENRINVLDSNAAAKKGQDIQLVHIILSDMDHIYSRQKKAPFHRFLNDFAEWTRAGGRISTHVVDVVKDIEDHLTSTSEDLVTKLTNEVRVFLEITVDP